MRIRKEAKAHAFFLATADEFLDLGVRLKELSNGPQLDMVAEGQFLYGMAIGLYFGCGCSQIVLMEALREVSS